MAELSKDIAAGLAEFLKSLPDAPKGPTEEFLKAVAKQKAIRDATHKTRKYAYYLVGPEGGFVNGRLYSRGEVVQMPVDKLPSRTWRPTTAEGVALAEAELKKELAKAAQETSGAQDDDALEQDELDADVEASGDEPDLDEEPEAKPTPPAKPKAKAKAAKPAPEPKKGKAGKSNRASDQDVA